MEFGQSQPLNYHLHMQELEDEDNLDQDKEEDGHEEPASAHFDKFAWSCMLVENDGSDDDQ